MYKGIFTTNGSGLSYLEETYQEQMWSNNSKWWTNCSVVPFQDLSRTVVVTSVCNLCFSAVAFEKVVISGANSSQTSCASMVSRCFITMVLPMSLSRCLLKTVHIKSYFNLNNSKLSTSLLGLFVGCRISSQSWALHSLT